MRTFDEYSKKAISTLVSDHDLADIDAALIAQVFGLVGESGEVAEKFKKLIRDNGGKMSEQEKMDILKELGDVLWYINAISHLLGSDISQVAEINISKLRDRKERHVIAGSGDDR